MPKLVKGGKHVFGWSRVARDGQIRIPPEALQEYSRKDPERLIVISGSQTSGGFGLASLASLRGSPLATVAGVRPDLASFAIPEGELLEHRGRAYSWVEVRAGVIRLPSGTLARYGIALGDDLLVIRGSGLALGFAVRGPIVEEARKHPELERFLASG
jgi:hypothetical protein